MTHRQKQHEKASEAPEVYRNGEGNPVIFANKAQAIRKALELGGDWSVHQSPESRRFYVRKLAPNIEEGATLEEMIAKHKAYGLSVAEHQVEAQKVFIPDNEGGGTWETWKANDALSQDQVKRLRGERNHYKTSAEKLAEALRDILSVNLDKELKAVIGTLPINAGRAALAQWEAGQ